MGRAYEVRKASIQKTGAAKAKLYSTYAKEIYLAAKKGIPEIESNVLLKRLVEKAKKEQVPNDIIHRAIEKAKGAGGEDYETVIYEGFGPGASTLIIKTLTDNVNRTVGFVRAAFNKVHKSLGVTNSVSYNYDYLAHISFNYEESEKIFEELMDDERTYKPDFTLNLFGENVYLEYFGIGDSDSILERKYTENKKRKMEYHKLHGTKIIFIDVISEKKLLDVLEEKLIETGFGFVEKKKNGK